MARRHKVNIDGGGEQNPFAMSTGDMMSGLMFVFVLLIIALIWQIATQNKKSSDAVSEYQDTRDEIYKALKIAFDDSLYVWGAELDSSSLTIRFNEIALDGTPVLFGSGDTLLPPRYKSVMNHFFPSYLEILSDDKFRNDIEEIRIEGHTDSTKCYKQCETIERNYLYNMNLSQARSRNVLRYGLSETAVANRPDLLEFARENIIATGLSFSQPRQTQDKSRRVEIRVRTKAQDKIDAIIKSLKGESSNGVTP